MTSALAGPEGRRPGDECPHRDECGRGREFGQILVLVMGYVVLCLMVASVVVGASAVHIEHRRLLSAADGAARAAADSFTFADASAGEGLPGAVLSVDRVRGAVREFLTSSGATQRFEHFAVVDAGSPDGRSARVTLGAVVRLPLVGVLLPEGVRIEATSTARARLAR